ncbi:hypothetical protein OG871_40305 (plasmid) [Kitasatospora sp. NBC_00374]|uniref:hypothetical protein n=1 Tax=Kitasatospora sp. NBC_00374 TaxID=2975964 RepID=UPI002F9189EB
MADERFEHEFRAVESFAAAVSNGDAWRETSLRFGGQTQGEAIAALAQWSSANEELTDPYVIRAVRLHEAQDSIPPYSLIITVHPG